MYRQSTEGREKEEETLHESGERSNLRAAGEKICNNVSAEVISVALIWSLPEGTRI